MIFYWDNLYQLPYILTLIGLLALLLIACVGPTLARAAAILGLAVFVALGYAELLWSWL